MRGTLGPIAFALLTVVSLDRVGEETARVPAPSTSGRCASCHLPNGFGRPESASLAGLPAIYIEQQLADYRKGVRKSPAPATAAEPRMDAIAATVSGNDLRALGEYFSSIKYTGWVRVVETPEVVGRIVEVPDDSASGFVAYVPAGSLRRGEALVTTGGGGRTVRCALCHGEDVKGIGPVPSLAGRSPTYQVRQLYDMKHGMRRGLGADLMKTTVARLSELDMIAIAAYTASRQP